MNPVEVHGRTAERVQQWSGIKVVHLESLLPWVSDLKREMAKFIIPTCPSGGRKFISPEDGVRLAALAVTKVEELNLMAVDDESFLQVYESL